MAEVSASMRLMRPDLATNTRNDKSLNIDNGNYYTYGAAKSAYVTRTRACSDLEICGHMILCCIPLPRQKSSSYIDLSSFCDFTRATRHYEQKLNTTRCCVARYVGQRTSWKTFFFTISSCCFGMACSGFVSETKQLVPIKKVIWTVSRPKVAMRVCSAYRVIKGRTILAVPRHGVLVLWQ